MHDNTRVTVEQRHRSRFAWRAAWIALAVHTVLIIAFALWLRTTFRQSSEGMMVWLLWCWIDFPCGFLVMLTELPVGSLFPYSLETENIRFAIQFGIFGGAQYFLFVGWRFGRRRSAVVHNTANANATSENTSSLADRDNPYSAPQAQPSEHA